MKEINEYHYTRKLNYDFNLNCKNKKTLQKPFFPNFKYLFSNWHFLFSFLLISKTKRFKPSKFKTGKKDGVDSLQTERGAQIISWRPSSYWSQHFKVKPQAQQGVICDIVNIQYGGRREYSSEKARKRKNFQRKHDFIQQT